MITRNRLQASQAQNSTTLTPRSPARPEVVLEPHVRLGDPRLVDAVVPAPVGRLQRGDHPPRGAGASRCSPWPRACRGRRRPGHGRRSLDPLGDLVGRRPRPPSAAQLGPPRSGRGPGGHGAATVWWSTPVSWPAPRKDLVRSNASSTSICFSFGNIGCSSLVSMGVLAAPSMPGGTSNGWTSGEGDDRPWGILMAVRGDFRVRPRGDSVAAYGEFHVAAVNRTTVGPGWRGG